MQPVHLKVKVECCTSRLRLSVIVITCKLMQTIAFALHKRTLTQLNECKSALFLLHGRNLHSSIANLILNFRDILCTNKRSYVVYSAYIYTLRGVCTVDTVGTYA